MREVAFLSRESPAVVEAVQIWRDRGPVGLCVAQYMADRVANKEIAARSFALYRHVLNEFTLFALVGVNPNVRRISLREAFSHDHVAQFLNNLRASPFQQRLARQVLRHFGRTWGQDLPESLLVPLDDLEWDGERVVARGAPVCVSVASETTAGGVLPASSGSRIPSRAEFAKIDEEVSHILRFTASARGAHTASDYTVMRAAAVAFCRFGGALAADIASMKMADVLTGEGADADPKNASQAVGGFWRALRPRRTPGLSGEQKFATLSIEYEPLARAPIIAWIKERQRGGAGDDDPVFVHPSTKTPLARPFVWRLIAGHDLTEPKRMDDPIHTPRGERPPVKDRESPPLLSPSRLRHAQGVGLVERFGSGTELNRALRKHMGVSRGLAPLYRSNVLANPSPDECARSGSAAEPEREPLFEAH